MNVVLLWTLLSRADCTERCLIVLAELVVLFDVFRRVLSVVKEASRVAVIVCITEIVELATERVLNELLLLGSILTRVNVELASR